MRLRITFSKTGALRYTGHLDLHKIWERTVRRAGLPLAYTQGFHPGPKIQLAAALPLGFSSRAEVVDVWLDEAEGPVVQPSADVLQAAVPPGLTILEISEVDAHAPALQTLVVSAEYEATLLDPVDEADLARRLADLLAAPSLPRERRGKAYDLRPLIEQLSLAPSSPLPPGVPSGCFAKGRGEGREEGVRGSDGSPSRLQGQAPAVHIFMRLAAREGATGRPEEVLDALGIPLEAAHIERTRLIFETDSPPAA